MPSINAAARARHQSSDIHAVFDSDLSTFRVWLRACLRDERAVNTLQQLDAEVLLCLVRPPAQSRLPFVKTDCLARAALALRRVVLSNALMSHALLVHYPSTGRVPVRFQFAQDLLEVAQMAEQLLERGVQRLSVVAA